MSRPKPSAITGTAELNATIERVALIRLAITGQVRETGSRYTLVAAEL